MNIHEYQAKEILKRYGVPVPEGRLVTDAASSEKAAEEIQSVTGTNKWVVKAQIHAGGRGKGGGVKLASSLSEVKAHAENILGMTLVTPQTGSGGKLVRSVLVVQDVYCQGESAVQEFYMSLLLDRAAGRYVLVYSPQGGMDIEAVAAHSPDKIFKEIIHPMGLQPFQARKIAFNLGLQGKAFQNMVRFVDALARAFLRMDATLVEINPVVKTSDGIILAVDAKVSLDDNALFRHMEYSELRDKSEEDPAEVEAGEYSLNFVKLDGNVGCMVNGAGLAMATMDIIKLAGGNPANFLDVGGGANAHTVEAGFRIILKDPHVKAILINIFGGIVRCDRVAQGIVDAYKSIGTISIPVVVRLQGTNATEGKALIDNSGLRVLSATTLREAADLVRAIV